MENKKTIEIRTSAVVIVCIMIVLLVAGVIGVTIYHQTTANSFIIPDNYILKYSKRFSAVDGSDDDYYIYNDKVIHEMKSYSPIKNSHKITIYENLDINTNEIETYVNNQKTKDIIVGSGLIELSEGSSSIGTSLGDTFCDNLIEKLINNKKGKIILDI